MTPKKLTFLLQNPRILHDGQPVLRERAQPVSRALRGSPEFSRLIDAMVEHMRDAPGVGLAAPQLGIGLRIVVMEDRPEYIARLAPGVAQQTRRHPLALTVLVNPVIRRMSAEKVRFLEGCLSIPGYAAQVARHLQCEVEAVSHTGAPVQRQLAGWQARIIQHEVDHLNGTLYTARMEPDTLRPSGP